MASHPRHACCVRWHPPAQDLLPPEELAWLLKQRQRSLALASVLSAIVATSSIDPQLKSAMDVQLSEFVLVQGSCARIFATAIPSAYTRWVDGCVHGHG